jgi:hypothetical protein
MADRKRQPLGSLSAVSAFVRRSKGRAGASARAAAPAGAPDGTGSASPPIDPATLPMPISRRRMAFVAGGLVVALLLVAFGHQVSDAAAASDRAAQLRIVNAGLRQDLADLQADLGRVQDDTYVGIAARSYGLGAKHEIPFVLAAGAPTLPPDAPGSAAVRLGADTAVRSPLDAWLDLLFGSGR